MKLLMFRALDGTARPGILIGDRLVPFEQLPEAASLPGTLLDLIRGGQAELDRVRDLASGVERDIESMGPPLGQVEILAPLDPPTGNVLAIGRNYAEHAAESARAQGREVQPPTVFTKGQNTISGPYDGITLPTSSNQVDWEAELGVVIGKPARDVPAATALEYVFGYTVLNDVSARDVQYGWGGQFFKGKSFDSFCPTGPWIVTAGELPDPQNLELRCRVNGVTKQSASTADMIYSVAELISWLSAGMTLPAGTLIATGTPAGVGQGRDPKEFLRAGDTLETEIVGIGALRNKILASGV